MLVHLDPKLFEQAPERASEWSHQGHHVVISPPEWMKPSSNAPEPRAAIQSTPGRMGLVLDGRSRTVLYPNTGVTLTLKEWLLLCHLLNRLGQTVTRDSLIPALSPWGDGPSSNSVDVHVSALRRKLPALPLRTVRGAGYRLEG